jgi:hypothetical protein
MCLSVAYWLTQSNADNLVLNISLYDLDDSAVQPIARLYRDIPRVAAGSLLSGYFLALVSSSMLGTSLAYHPLSLSLPTTSNSQRTCTTTNLQSTLYHPQFYSHPRSRFGFGLRPTFQPRIFICPYPGFYIPNYICYQPILVINITYQTLGPLYYF